MEKSPMVFAGAPNWYKDLVTRRVGDYFGSLSSLYPDEKFVTFDGDWIVSRGSANEVAVMQNACLHAGVQILNTPGTQNDKEIRCPGHQWLYDAQGKLIACPKFVLKGEHALHRPNYGVWNGYVLGYKQDELTALDGFGASLGLPEGFLNADEFWFGKEVCYDLPYPRPLMMINYKDGVHVPKYHEFTFGPAINDEEYNWEFGPDDTNVSYSIQLVKVRPNMKKHVDRIMHMHGKKIADLGWADLHFWLEEKMPDAKTPIDRDIFAVWASIYGNAYQMPELYEGGRLLANSYLISRVDADGVERNYNYVEFYIHKSVPEHLRSKLLDKFIYAYRQSAEEDDELCAKLWAAHRRNDISFKRIVHQTLEAGDSHYRNWFMRHFVA